MDDRRQKQLDFACKTSLHADMAPLDDDTRDLLCRLFATASELLEDAHEAATKGQAPSLTAGAYAARASDLQDRLTDVLVIAAAADAIARRVGAMDRTP